MTPAEELRQAAATIRVRAEGATPERWDVRHESVMTVDDDGPLLIADCSFGDRRQRDAVHIATWSPFVALAVAAWLDRTADTVEVEDALAAARGFVTHRRTGEEWTLARLINASSAGSDA